MYRKKKNCNLVNKMKIKTTWQKMVVTLMLEKKPTHVVAAVTLEDF